MATAEKVKAVLLWGPRDGATLDVPKPLPAVLRVAHKAGDPVVESVERYQYEAPRIDAFGETVPGYRYVRP
jgi:hypothetical protein